MDSATLSLMPHVSGLFIYPVKSLRGCAVSAVEIDPLGFVGDRRFLIVDSTGKFLTQRTVPRLALIDAQLSPGELTLSADGNGGISVPLASDPTVPLRSVSVWKSEGLQAEDCGAAVSSWLSGFVGFTCHLVRIGEKYSRANLKSAARPGDNVSFADACPFLIISEASLAHLNNRILENHGEPIPMNRFRPNLVVDGCDAFAEDAWTRFRIGNVLFRSAGKSDRCIVTTTDQLTGERGKEPLKTLATFRRGLTDPTAVYFGVNLIHETKRGTIRISDRIELISSGGGSLS